MKRKRVDDAPFVAGQLGIQAAGLLAEYAGRKRDWNQPAEIRDVVV